MQIYLKNYDICENVKFGAISWKFDILSYFVLYFVIFNYTSNQMTVYVAKLFVHVL